MLDAIGNRVYIGYVHLLCSCVLEAILNPFTLYWMPRMHCIHTSLTLELSIVYILHDDQSASRQCFVQIISCLFKLILELLRKTIFYCDRFDEIEVNNIIVQKDSSKNVQPKRDLGVRSNYERSKAGECKDKKKRKARE